MFGPTSIVVFPLQKIARADATGCPHVVPVCYALTGDTVYLTIDEKPKRKPGAT
jgi:hypothetical protein